MLPVYNTEASALRDVISSVIDQAYDNWELCIADDCSTVPHVVQILNEMSQGEPRIKVVRREANGHIAHASNSALSVAEGEFVALLDHDDTLAPHALFRVVEALNDDSSLDMIYSDEDKLAGLGGDARREEPAFKAGWSPLYFLSFMYVGHLGVYRTSLVREVGAFRPGYEGSQDYDLVLRLTERTSKVRHINDILYHWRKYPGSVAGDIDAKPYAFKAAAKALEDALVRRRIPGTVETTKWKGIYRVRPALPPSLPIKTVEWSGNISEQLEGISRPDQYALILSPLCTELADARLALLEAALAGGAGVVGGIIKSAEDKIQVAGFARDRGTLSSRFHQSKIGSVGYCCRLVAPHDVEAVPCDAMLVRGDVIDAARSLAEVVRPSTSGEWSMVYAEAARKIGVRVVFTPWALFECAEELPPKFQLSERVVNALGIANRRDPMVPAGVVGSTELSKFFY